MAEICSFVTVAAIATGGVAIVEIVRGNSDDVEENPVPLVLAVLWLINHYLIPWGGK